MVVNWLAHAGMESPASEAVVTGLPAHQDTMVMYDEFDELLQVSSSFNCVRITCSSCSESLCLMLASFVFLVSL